MKAGDLSDEAAKLVAGQTTFAGVWHAFWQLCEEPVEGAELESATYDVISIATRSPPARQPGATTVDLHDVVVALARIHVVHENNEAVDWPMTDIAVALRTGGPEDMAILHQEEIPAEGGTDGLAQMRSEIEATVDFEHWTHPETVLVGVKVAGSS